MQCKQCHRTVRFQKDTEGTLLINRMYEGSDRHYCDFYQWLAATPMSNRLGNVDHPPLYLLTQIKPHMTTAENQQIAKVLRQFNQVKWKVWNQLWMECVRRINTQE